MKRLSTISLLLLAALLTMGASVKISDLTLSTSPSTNTFIEIADMNAATKSGKYLLTNLATVAQLPVVPTMIVSNNVASSGLLAVDATKTNGVAATAGMITNLVNSQYVLKAGDTNVGTLGVQSLYLPSSGLIVLGSNAVSITGIQSGFADIKDVSIGESASWDWWLGSFQTNGFGSGYGYIEMWGTTNEVTIDETVSGSGNLIYEHLRVLEPDTKRLKDVYLRNGTPVTLLDPSATQAAQTATYILGTLTNVSTRNLLEVRNNTTNKFTVDYDGTVTLSGVQGGYTRVLTDASATSILYIPVASANTIGGEILYTINATDGTDTQEITGRIKFGAVAKTTTVTPTLADVQNAAAVSAGTLSATLASNVATNNVWALTVNADTSLTTTNLTINWRLESPKTLTVNAL